MFMGAVCATSSVVEEQICAVHMGYVVVTKLAGYGAGDLNVNDLKWVQLQKTEYFGDISQSNGRTGTAMLAR